MELTAVPLGIMPLAFASAIVRYRLMDVEIILKRLLVYTAAVSAIVAIYIVIVRTTGGYFVSTEDDQRWVIAALATVVVLLLARPVKDGVQSAIDRVFYRDRYDYRRALVSFARDLNTDLELDRLAERLLTRVKDTLVVDRLCLMSATGYGDFDAVRHTGFDQPPPPIGRGSAVACGSPTATSCGSTTRWRPTRFPAEEVEFWRDTGLYYFVPCVSKGVGDRGARARPARERRAADQRRPRAWSRRWPDRWPPPSRTPASTASCTSRRRSSIGCGCSTSTFSSRSTTACSWSAATAGDALEPRARAHLRAAPRRGSGPARSRCCSTPAVVAAVESARTASPNGGTEYRVPLRPRGSRAEATLLVNITTVPLLPMPGREWAGTIVMFEDVTERAQLEEQLRVSERMASLGLLAAGVAHEVNTPLTGISSYTQMLLEQATRPTRGAPSWRRSRSRPAAPPDRQRAAEPVAAGAADDPSDRGRPQRRGPTCCRCSSTSSTRAG